MGFRNLARKFVNWATDDPNAPTRDREVDNSKYYSSTQTKIGIPNPTNNAFEYNRGFNFLVFNAIGGKVIQVRSYRPDMDVGRSELYIITDKEDLGNELGQIITRESLAR